MQKRSPSRESTRPLRNSSNTTKRSIRPPPKFQRMRRASLKTQASRTPRWAGRANLRKSIKRKKVDADRVAYTVMPRTAKGGRHRHLVSLRHGTAKAKEVRKKHRYHAGKRLHGRRGESGRAIFRSIIKSGGKARCIYLIYKRRFMRRLM